jgi:hypothetical protein
MNMALAVLILTIAAALVLWVLMATLRQGGAVVALRNYCMTHPLPPTKTIGDHLNRLERIFLAGIKV